MKALLVLLITLLAAASAYAYGRSDATGSVALLVEETASACTTEPAVMLLSGGVLLALAGAVRRMPV